MTRSNIKIAIFGASGFAHETADVAYACGFTEIILLTNDPIEKNQARFDTRPDCEASNLHNLGYLFAIGIGDPSIRKRIFEKHRSYQYPNLVHPRATFGINGIKNLSNSKGNIVTAGVVITSNILIGNFNIFNLNTTIGHDCELGNFISIMPNVNVSGNVIIEDEVFVGVGAIILQGNSVNKLVIRQQSIIGASSLVTKSIEKKATVVGIPARTIKRSLAS